jgi:hypothetical protein
MKRAVVTMSFGTEWDKVLSLTQPRIEDFAKRNQIDFILINRSVMDPKTITSRLLETYWSGGATSSVSTSMLIAW